MSMNPPVSRPGWQCPAHGAGKVHFGFVFAHPGRHAENTPEVAFHSAAGSQDCYPFAFLRSGPTLAGPIFATFVVGQGSAHISVFRDAAHFFRFSFSNIRIDSGAIKTLERGSILCSSHHLSPPRLSRRFCQAVSARMAAHRPTAPRSGPSAVLLPVQLWPTPPVAARPKARLLAPSWAVCPVASRACRPATRADRPSATICERMNNSRPSGASPRMVFSFGGKPCSRKS